MSKKVNLHFILIKCLFIFAIILPILTYNLNCTNNMPYPYPLTTFNNGGNGGVVPQECILDEECTEGFCLLPDDLEPLGIIMDLENGICIDACFEIHSICLRDGQCCTEMCFILDGEFFQFEGEGICVECEIDEDCTDPQTFCDDEEESEDFGLCIGCLEYESDCDRDRQCCSGICHGEEDFCVDCEDDEDCPPGFYCDEEEWECFEDDV